MSTTIPSSGYFSFANLRTVFAPGSTAEIFMSHLYANSIKGYTTGVSGIPNSGSEIRFNVFKGKSKAGGNGLYSFSSHTFTNANATGRSGPSLSQCRSAYSSAAWAQDTTNNYLNMTTNGIQLWKVPATGGYTIRCAGAKGGDANGYSGGSGRVVEAIFNLTQGQIINILVGQSGSSATNGSTFGAGGGGGTFVINNSDNAILIIAGGGGGAKNNNSGYSAYGNGINAPYTNAGTLPSGASGSTGGNGGGAYQYNWSGGGGGGYSGNGGISPYGTSVGSDGNAQSTVAGIAYLNGGLGGQGWRLYNTGAAQGGFGGGGGCVNDSAFYPGGGGGYSGGNGTEYSTDEGGHFGGGGGGFFSNGTGTTNIGSNSGHGYVTITPNFTITVGGALYSFSSHTFTNANATGRSGPSLSQCRNAYSSASWAQDTTNNYLNMTQNGIQMWKVPSTGNYLITCAGASGGTLTNGGGGTGTGGNGAFLTTTLSLTQGHILSILVGQKGTDMSSTYGGAGGGGGTFVYNTTSSTLLMASGGGSGGGGGDGVNAGQNATTTTTGGAGLARSGACSGSGGGTNGSAGVRNTTYDQTSAPGAGFSSEPSTFSRDIGTTATPQMFSTGGAGGSSSNSYGNGGFGGGAAGSERKGGAAGGYTGGGTVSTNSSGMDYGAGGGGGSYSSVATSSSGINNNGTYGMGYVTITLLSRQLTQGYLTLGSTNPFYSSPGLWFVFNSPTTFSTITLSGFPNRAITGISVANQAFQTLPTTMFNTNGTSYDYAVIEFYIFQDGANTGAAPIRNVGNVAYNYNMFNGGHNIGTQTNIKYIQVRFMRYWYTTSANNWSFTLMSNDTNPALSVDDLSSITLSVS